MAEDVVYAMYVEENVERVTLCIEDSKFSFSKSQLKEMIVYAAELYDELVRVERRHKYQAKKLAKEAERICNSISSMTRIGETP